MRSIPALLAALATPLLAAAQDHGGHDDRHPMPEIEAARLVEPGQGAFAALAEVVAMLEADPGHRFGRASIWGRCAIT